jgi:hypothetical protein
MEVPIKMTRAQERRPRAIWISAVIAALCFAACAETPQEKAQRLDPVLSAAGFQMIQPRTPKQQEMLALMAPLKMNYYVGKDGQARYWFPDPYQCACVFKGDAKAYQQYQNLRLQQQMVQEEEQTAELNQDAAMQMNTFEPYFFPY